MLCRHRGQQSEDGRDEDADAVDPFPSVALSQAASDQLSGDVPVEEGSKDESLGLDIPRKRPVLENKFFHCRFYSNAVVYGLPRLALSGSLARSA